MNTCHPWKNWLSLIRAEMMELAVHAMQVLRRVYHPDGFNVGANIGEAAGAGDPRSRPSARSRALERRYKFHASTGRNQGHP